MLKLDIVDSHRQGCENPRPDFTKCAHVEVIALMFKLLVLSHE
ncbi:hypothetical protein KC19_VG276800 [Ceratodon purpureus]|uniref:Uncharacterized protein n=1 Tax=Ceratodon purpureus TaxID=3225 RepID=A0A8T0HW10_CERPU|nr:hypothetical protein KC19_VG276800 [Ceratodon purpureus]